MKKILSTFIITAFIAQAVMSAAPASALNEEGTGTNQAAVALGPGSSADGAGSIAIGNGASATTEQFNSENPITKGGSIAIGFGQTTSANIAIALGYSSVASSESSISIGTLANVSSTAESAIAFGRSARVAGASSNSIALGSASVSNSDNSAAIGYGAVVSGAENSIALGSYSQAFEANTLSIGSSRGTNIIQRTISNVASHAYSNDTATHTYAATTGQLYDINKSVADTLGITYEQLTEEAAEKKYFTIGGDETTKYTVQEALDELYANSSSASDPLAVTYDDEDKESVTLKSASGGGVKLSGLADAALDGNSTDAVTGAQLFATNTTLGGLGTSAAAVFGSGVSYADGAFTVTGTPFAGADTIAGGFTNLSSSLDSLGDSMAVMMGGGASYSGGSLSNFSVEINGQTYNNVAAAIGKLAEGWTFGTTDATPPSGQGGAAGSSTILPGDTLTVNAGDNIDISGSDGDYTLSVSPDPTFDSVTADEITANDSLNVADKVTADDTGLTVAGTGTNSVKIDGDKFTLTGTDGSGVSHTLVISGGGMDMGGTKATNMASGEISETSTDGITGGQLWGLGDSVAGILGGTSSFTNGALTAGLTVNGTSYDNIQDALTAAAGSGGAGGSVSFADSDSRSTQRRMRHACNLKIVCKHTGFGSKW